MDANIIGSEYNELLIDIVAPVFTVSEENRSGNCVGCDLRQTCFGRAGLLHVSIANWHEHASKGPHKTTRAMEEKRIQFADLVWEIEKDGFYRRIYLGSQRAAPIKSDVDAIVNCTLNFPNHHERTCRIAVSDECAANILVYLDGATSFMHSVLQAPKNTSVLVHCQMGISRSATVVVSYLMRYHNMTAVEALEIIRQSRPRARPNPGFWEQLLIYERRLGNEDGTNVEKVDPYSHEWLVQSLAKFQTIGQLDIGSEDLFPDIEADVDANKIMLVSIDHVCGRGLLEADLPWLTAVSKRLCDLELDPQAALDFHLEDDSEFRQSWAGELYDGMIEKLRRAVADGCRS